MNHNPNNPNPGVLSSLTPEQQEQILAWLETMPPTKVAEKIAAPPPHGFGVQTWPNSVRRFYARHRLKTLADETALAADQLALAAQAGDFDSATAAALRQLAFQLANSPKFGSQQFAVLSRWILKLHDHKLQEAAQTICRDRLELEREKFRFNAARQALIHFAELAIIARNRHTDDEAKIKAAAALLFQPAPPPLSESSLAAPKRSEGGSEAAPLINTQVYLGESNELNDRTASAVSSATDN